MKEFVILFSNIITVLLTILLWNGVEGNIQVESFQMKKGTASGDVSNHVVSARSKIHCATMCSNDETCASFAYNKNTKTCEMANKKVSGSEKNIYVKKGFCPSDKGYQLWTYPDMKLCIRYSSSAVSNQTHAKAQCEADGGHLVLIENESMKSHMEDIATILGATGQTFLDGEDKSGSQEHKDWKGNIMTWLPWSPSEPNMGSNVNCIFSILGSEIKFFDGFCEWPRDCLFCQIDV